jgi:Predicted Zn peptidase
MNKLILFLFFFVVGCTLDYRHATIVVKDQKLLASTKLAASWWKKATGGGVVFEFGKDCPKEGRCVVVFFDNNYHNVKYSGLTTWTHGIFRNEVSKNIHINTTVKDQLLIVVLAHELGHVVDQTHVSVDGDIMRDHHQSTYCIGGDMFEQYEEMYGKCNDCEIICLNRSDDLGIFQDEVTR